MKKLNKEDCIFILNSLIDSKTKALSFYDKMPMQDKVCSQLKNEINNLIYVLDFIESN